MFRACKPIFFITIHKSNPITPQIVVPQLIINQDQNLKNFHQRFSMHWLHYWELSNYQAAIVVWVLKFYVVPEPLSWYYDY